MHQWYTCWFIRLTLLWRSPAAGEWSTAESLSSACRCHGRQRAPWSSCPFLLNPDPKTVCSNTSTLEWTLEMLKCLLHCYYGAYYWDIICYCIYVTWISCRLVSSVTEGLAIEKQVPSHGSRRVFRVSTPAYCPPKINILTQYRYNSRGINQNCKLQMWILPSAAVRLRIVNSWPWILAVSSISSQHLFRFWSQEITYSIKCDIK